MSGMKMGGSFVEHLALSSAGAVCPYVACEHSCGLGLRPLLSPIDPAAEERYLQLIRGGLPAAGRKQDVLVVGAGMAGLVAASLLKQAGHAVRVLEADQKVGGRILTLRDCFSEGVYAEAGAMRIPTYHRLTTAYLERFNLTTIPFINECPEAYIYANGVRLRQHEYEADPDRLGYPVAPKERGKTALQLLQSATRPLLEEILHDPEKTWPAMVERYGGYSIDGFLRSVGGLSDGAIEMIGVLLDLEGSFLESIRESLDINPENRYLAIEGGSDLLPRGFLPELEDCITYGARVMSVSQSEDGVSVVYEDEEGSSNQARAQRLILTPAFSVLRHVEFSPPLSHGKRKAFRELNYDPATKILLEFKSRFWEREGIRGGGSVTDLPARFLYYPSHGIGSSGSAVLLASYTWTNDALRWDALPERDRIRFALRDVARIHGEQVFKEFLGGVSYSWNQCPFTQGGFALFNPGQQGTLHSSVAAIEGRIHFAGEHTTLTHAWIQGAIESGIRAAAEVHLETPAHHQHCC